MFSTVWGKKIIIFSLAVALHWRLLWGGGRLELWLLLNDTSKTPAATEKKKFIPVEKGVKVLEQNFNKSEEELRRGCSKF